MANTASIEHREWLTKELHRLQRQQDVLAVRVHTVKDELRKLYAKGNYEVGGHKVTKYAVKRTTVRKHERKAFTALRVY